MQHRPVAVDSTMPTFAARRSSRPLAIVAGLGFLLACGAAALALALAGHTDLAPYLVGAGALGYFVSTIAAVLPQRVTLDVDGRRIATSWRGAIDVAEVRVGSWVTPGIDAQMGTVLHLRGRGGTLRVGGEGLDGDGYERTAPPSRTVDCDLPAADLERLLAMFDVRPGPAGPLAIPLVRNAHNVGGVMRTMAAWFAVMGMFAIGGAVLGNTELGERVMRSPDGQIAIAVTTGGLAVLAIVWMVVRGRRVRMPELELRFEDDALVIARSSTIASPGFAGARNGLDRSAEVIDRLPWTGLAIERLRYQVAARTGRFEMPVLVLGGGSRPLRLGAWTTELAWDREVTAGSTRRGPTWVVGATKWRRLLDALAAHAPRR